MPSRQRLQFSPCSGEEVDPGFEKIALFAANGVPTHAARQLPGSRWTSKLGRREDIEHDLHALRASMYGAVAQVFKRPVMKDRLPAHFAISLLRHEKT